MSATQAADFVFVPKVWADHIMAYFDRKLVYGAFALRDDSLTTAPGLTQNFPYFKAIGDAEEPTEDQGLTVDKLSDDSFSVTVKEVSKAVGASKKSFKVSAARTERVIQEIHEQIGRVMAEKVDKDLYTEFAANGNSVSGFAAAANTDTMTIRRLNQGKIVGFGDKNNQAVVCFMHSLQFMDLMADTTSGFMNANANDPLFMVEGFQGRLLGMAIVTVDTVAKNTAGQVGSKDTYDCWIHKANAYGFMVKQEMELESDYDILHRQWVFAGDQWYGVKSFHAKINTLYKKTCLIRTASSV